MEGKQYAKQHLEQLACLVGESPSMKRLKELIAKVAGVDFSLLIIGESGTGKELVARAVHQIGIRQSGPFVAVNCAGIPEHLLEAELFGYRKGAFTGAAEDRQGLIASAQNGTLFLDEIADMALILQAKMLRLLQEGEVRRLGENRVSRIDMRVVSATNKDIGAMVKRGAFREDLFYRLQDLTLEVPPLREHREDIPLLVEHFMRKHGYGNANPALVLGLAECLVRREWPGNVRELESEVKRAITFGFQFRADAQAVSLDRSLKGMRERAERLRLIQALRESGGRRVQAARQLGVTRQTLFNLLRKHKLEIQASEIRDKEVKD